MSVLGKRDHGSSDVDDEESALNKPHQKRQKLSSNNHNKIKAETENENKRNEGLDEESKLQNNEPITLNVGGIKYMTTTQTLTGYKSMLKAWFSGNYKIKPSSDGTFFIDRNGKLFEYVLEYFRTGSLILPSNWDKNQIWKFYIELKYFMIESLFDIVLLKLFDSKLITNHSFKLKIINKIFGILKGTMEDLKNWKLRLEYDTFDEESKASEKTEYKWWKIQELHAAIGYSLLLIESNCKIYGLFLYTTNDHYLYNLSFSFQCGFNSANEQNDNQVESISFDIARVAKEEESSIDEEIYWLFCNKYPIIIKGYKKGYIQCGDLELKADDEWRTITKMELWSISNSSPRSE